ncbi:protocadherin Fat 4-like [Babylonia areolata]|uniref:protocadherin Fat 4-like n=1 Tax=Babylonia areolata TaxID=304850 RepID=UPI003FD0A172
MQELYYASVTEATSYTFPVLRVQALDLDYEHEGEVRYAIEDGPLSIDEVTGHVRVKGQLDFDTRYQHVIRVEARDLGTAPSLTGTATILLTVTPVNEFDPVWISGTHFLVSEDTVPGSVVFQLNATDNDFGWDGKVAYRSSRPLTPDLPFLVDQSGRVLLAAPLDRETTDAYTLPVIAHDLSASPEDRRSVTMTLHVTVSDVNDVAPDCRRRQPVAVVVFPWVGSTVTSVDCREDVDTVNGRLGYGIVGGNVDGAFEINSTNGQLTATRHPTLDLYHLIVEANDGGTPPMTSRVDVVIMVEPELRLSSLPLSARVGEDAAVGTVLHRVAACCSFTTLRYELLSGNEDKLFHLHRGNGVITLVRHLDREAMSRHVLNVKVGDKRGQTATAILEVVVEDANDNAPVFNPAFSWLRLPKMPASGTILGAWSATDLDQGTNAALTYSLADSLNGSFSVNASSGVITVLKEPEEEYIAGSNNSSSSSTNNSSSSRIISLLIVAVDGGNTPLSATATVQLEIANEDEHSPQFLTSPGGTLTVAEDFPLGVVLLHLQAEDLDDPEDLNYTLTTTNTPFLVLPDSGQVILGSPLDREAVEEYSLQFLTMNHRGDSASLAVKVQVEDVDDHDPVFSNSVYEFHVPHNTKDDVIVGHVTVTDADVGENANFTLSIVSGNGAGYFALVDDGGLRTTRPLRYDGVREFVLTIRARKTGSRSDYRFSEATVRIQVLPAGTQPKFDVSSITLFIKENVIVNTIIHDVNATTLGATEGINGTLRYVIRTGNSKGLFHVKEYTGELQVVGTVDFEVDTDFVLEVDAQNKQDPAVKDSVTININVININDHSPEPGLAVYRFSIDEGSPEHSYVGQVNVSDDDADVFGEVSLTISGCSKLFSINASTGVITANEELNREEDDVRHACVVTATDGGQPPRSGVTSVVIEVRDVNEHPPRFDGGAPYILEVYENTPAGSTLITVLATDPDGGAGDGEVRFYIASGDPGGVFSLNASTGDLVLRTNLSAQNTPRFLLHLLAQDGGTSALTSFTTLTLTVVDVNDHAPVFAMTSRSVEVTVGRVASPGTELSVLNASDDEDMGDNARVSFAITAGNEEGLFSIPDPDSGRLTTVGWLTHARSVHTLTVTATDHGTPPLTTSTNVTVYVSPPLADDDADPSSSSLYFQNLTVAENASLGSVVGVLDPFPVASPGNGCVIVSGNHDDSFELVVEGEGGGGAVKVVVKGRLDYERRSVYYLWVNVSGDGGDGTTVRKLVQVNVTDVNDNTPQFEDGQILVLHVAEHTPAGHSVGSLRVLDADQPDTNGPLLFRVDSVTVQNVLTVTGEGQIQLTSSPDYETFHRVEAVVSVRDSHVPQLSSTISVTLNIIDVDERDFVTVTPAFTVYLSTETAHNTRERQIVHHLTAADFNLTESPTSSTSFLSVDTLGPFAIHDKTGEVTVSDPQRLANSSVYFLWVVCKVVAADGTVKSEMATLRVDTFDKYEHIVAVQLDLDVSQLETQKSTLLHKLQALFTATQRVGIYDVIAYGTSARRRLLAASSLALIYVVEDTSADGLNNVMGPKTFLTQNEILQVLQQSPDGTPVAGLTTAPLPVELVMPYSSGDPQPSTNPFTSTRLHFPLLVAVLCLLFIVVCVFVIGCLVYRAKRRRRWNLQSDKAFKTPQPAFYIRKESTFADDVSIASSTSLLDDDSGMGDSVGSRSLPRKSLTPSSSESNPSDDNATSGDEILLNPRHLQNGQAQKGPRPGQHSVRHSEASTSRRRKRFLWKKAKQKTTQQKDTFVYASPRPPLSWLPPLPPDDPGPHRRGSGTTTTTSMSGFQQSPRFGRRSSSTLSDLPRRRRGSQTSVGTSCSASSTEGSPSSSRRTSYDDESNVCPYAIPLSGRRPSAANVTTPVFTTGIVGVGAGLGSGNHHHLLLHSDPSFRFCWDAGRRVIFRGEGKVLGKFYRRWRGFSGGGESDDPGTPGDLEAEAEHGEDLPSEASVEGRQHHPQTHLPPSASCSARQPESWRHVIGARGEGGGRGSGGHSVTMS